MEHYEKLRRILDTFPSGAPESPNFDEILQLLFTPEEARIASQMSFNAKSPREIAQACGLEEEQTRAILETMADKVVIATRDKGDQRSYHLLPTIPGLFEFPFMTGGGTTMHDRLAELWQAYHHEALGEAFAGNPSPSMRVVPLESAIENLTRVHPYEEASKLIEQQSYLAVTKCACRVSVGACDRPLEVCLAFGTMARFLVQRGRAREITRAEALEVLKTAEEAGLVHTTNNSADKAGLICNCCPCCCTVLRGRTQLNHPHAFAVSAFVVCIDPADCTGCGICADERCPMQAIVIEDDTARVVPRNCIGCGLCTSTCPTGAITLQPLDQPPAVFNSAQDMVMTALAEKGKLEDFIAVMKK